MCPVGCGYDLTGCRRHILRPVGTLAVYPVGVGDRGETTALYALHCGSSQQPVLPADQLVFVEGEGICRRIGSDLRHMLSQQQIFYAHIFCEHSIQSLLVIGREVLGFQPYVYIYVGVSVSQPAKGADILSKLVPAHPVTEGVAREGTVIGEPDLRCPQLHRLDHIRIIRHVLGVPASVCMHMERSRGSIIAYHSHRSIPAPDISLGLDTKPKRS